MTDGELVQKAKKGDLDAYAELARRYQERIFRMIFSYTRNGLDADDLTQETFMQAFRSIAGFKERSSFYTWIYRIAVNRTLNHLKKASREKGREQLDDTLKTVESAGHASSSPEDRSLAGELEDRIREAVAGLPLLYRVPFELVVFQGQSHGQAAKVLKCSENTVSWRMYKARKMLQKKLTPYLQRRDPE